MSDAGTFPWTAMWKITMSFFSFTVYFEQHYFYGETKEAMKNKILWFVFL